MSGRYPYIKKRNYTHMMGEDKIIWERFIDKYPKRFDTVDYDWRVGEGIDLNPDWEDNIMRMANMITQKRIDVLAWNGEQPTIIEVKKRVGLSTLGQVLGYKELFVTEFKNIDIPDLLVITESIGADDRLVLERFNIPVEVV